MTKKYTTEKGYEITIEPIPLLLEKVRAAMEKNAPEIPMFTEKVGEHLTYHKITDEVAEDSAEHNPDWWAEYDAAWKEYKILREAFEEAVEERIWIAVALKSISGIELPEDESWITDQVELFDIEVPEGPRRRLAHYIQTEVMGGAQDMLQVTTIANGAELNDEDLMVVMDSFRSYIRGQVQGEEARPETPRPAVPGGGVEGIIEVIDPATDDEGLVEATIGDGLLPS